MVAFVVAFLMVVNTSLTAYAVGSDELSKKSDDYSMDYNYEDNTVPVIFLFYKNNFLSKIKISFRVLP